MSSNRNKMQYLDSFFKRETPKRKRTPNQCAVQDEDCFIVDDDDDDPIINEWTRLKRLKENATADMQLVETTNKQEQSSTTATTAPTNTLNKQAPQEIVLYDYNDGFDDAVNAASSLHSRQTRNREWNIDESILDEFQNDYDYKTETEESEVSNSLVNECETIVIDDDSDAEVSFTSLVQVNGKKIFRFFWWDAFEDPDKHPGSVFLFGKTFCDKSQDFVSCVVVVENIMRRIFVLPRQFTSDNPDVPVTQQDVYQEIKSVLGVTNFKSKFVRKNQSFDPDIPAEAEYLEVRYPAISPAINAKKEKGCFYSKIFGLSTSFLEIFLMERSIKGPCWLDVSEPICDSNRSRNSNKHEVRCTGATSVSCNYEMDRQVPPLVVAAINFRSVFNLAASRNEIVMASCVVHKLMMDNKSEPAFQQQFCAFFPPHDVKLPANLQRYLSEHKSSNIQRLNSENALLKFFLAKIEFIDPDLIVGYNLKNPRSILTESLLKNGLKFNQLSRLNGAITSRNLFIGRLVCDVKFSAQELIKLRAYDLNTLCEKVLKVEGSLEIHPNDVAKMFESNKGIIELVLSTGRDTQCIFEIMCKLNVIPIALHLSNMAGNLMANTLMGGVAQRIEYLLLHAFSNQNYIVPDKAAKSFSPSNSYTGGLVLEPKIGFYTNMILLMDFKSLYPSIIQEYNICFTTVKRTDDGAGALPASKSPDGILPVVMRRLVSARRGAQKLLMSPNLSEEERTNYDTRQKALKLMATSVYGCLGMPNARFKGRHLAALITEKGREVLENARVLVVKLGFDVLYGDTDSLMVKTYKTDYDQAIKLGFQLKQEVNKNYKNIELDIDAVFQSLLLLNKKKYGALVVSKDPIGELKFEKLYKGLDVVRRDSAQLAADAGQFILDCILSTKTFAESITSMQTYLAQIKVDLDAGSVPIESLTLTKNLSKDPEDYETCKHLSHVLVALRYNRFNKKRSNCRLKMGDAVSYVICLDGTTNEASHRAYHVDELKEDSSRLRIDVDYYLEFQVLPVITRLLEPFKLLDVRAFASCLGVTKAGLVPQSQVQVLTLEERPTIFTVLDFRCRKADCLVFKCRSCGLNNRLLTGSKFVFKCANRTCNVCLLSQLILVRNALVQQIRNNITKYYMKILICNKCKYEERRPSLAKWFRKGLSCPRCENAPLCAKYSAKELYLQLLAYKQMFNVANVKNQLNAEAKAGYKVLFDTVDFYLRQSMFAQKSMKTLFSLM